MERAVGKVGRMVQGAGRKARRLKGAAVLDMIRFAVNAAGFSRDIESERVVGETGGLRVKPN